GDLGRTLGRSDVGQSEGLLSFGEARSSADGEARRRIDRRGGIGAVFYGGGEFGGLRHREARIAWTSARDVSRSRAAEHPGELRVPGSDRYAHAEVGRKPGSQSGEGARDLRPHACVGTHGETGGGSKRNRVPCERLGVVYHRGC